MARLNVAMAIINTEMYEALLLAHVPEAKAKAAAAEVAKAQGFASGSDVSGFGVQLQPKIEERSAEVVSKADGRSAESLGEVNEVCAGIDKRFAEIKKSLAVLKFAVISWELIVIALLIKLVSFT